MNVKNGIIIDGMFHEMTNENVPCDKCSLLRMCNESDGSEPYICLCTLMNCDGFINRGKVKIEKED